MKRNRQKEIVQLLGREKVVSAQDLAERFEVSLATIKRDIQILNSKQIVRYVGDKKNGYWEIIKN